MSNSDKIKIFMINCIQLILIKYKGIKMAWNTPKINEISVGLEINSYACADK